ncbi:MAG: peptidoglycan editing factor PgeF [Acidobacteriota bacterium]
MLRISELAGVRYLQFAPLLERAHFTHFITLRQAGRDSEAAARALCRRLDVPEDRLVRLRQVHGSRVVVDPARGDDFSAERPLEGDGLILTRPGWFGVIRTADCIPVLAVAPQQPALALLHAGWRGLAAGIVEEGVAQLCETTAVDPETVTVILGPCIRACCYEVGPEVPTAFQKADRYAPDLEPGGRFDLVAAARLQLRRVGASRVYDSGLCTCCHPELCYSYRRNRTSHRHWTVAGFTRLGG